MAQQTQPTPEEQLVQTFNVMLKKMDILAFSSSETTNVAAAAVQFASQIINSKNQRIKELELRIRELEISNQELQKKLGENKDEVKDAPGKDKQQSKSSK